MPPLSEIADIKIDPKNIFVPLGAALTIAAAVFQVNSVWINLEKRVEANERAVIESSRLASQNHWTCQDMELYTTRLQLANPKMHLPAFPKECPQ